MAIRFTTQTNTGALISSDFPLGYSDVNSMFYPLYPPIDLDPSKWDIFSITICKEVSHGPDSRRCNFFLPVISAPCLLTGFNDSSWLHTVEGEDFESQYTLYVKVDPNNGSVIGVRFYDTIILGTGFVEDSDWKPIMTYYYDPYQNGRVPLLLLNNGESSYLIVVTPTYEDPTGFDLYMIDLTLADELSSEIVFQSDLYNLDALQYYTDIYIENFSKFKILREEHLQDELIGRVTFVSR